MSIALDSGGLRRLFAPKVFGSREKGDRGVASPYSRASEAAHQAGRSPLPPHSAAVGVGEAERDDVIERIKTAFAEGRLDRPEFDLRSHLALTARTRADLAALLADLQPLPQAPAPSLTPRRPTAGDRAWAMLAHWLGLPTSFIGPLILLLAKGKRSPYVRQQSVESLNFQLSFLLAQFLMLFVVGFTFGIGAVLYVPLAIGWLVLTTAGGIGAAVGDAFRYPVNVRMVR